VNPIDVGRHPGVDIRPVGIGAGNGSERHQSTEQIAIVLEQHQWSTSVAVALLGIGQATELRGLDAQLLAGVLPLTLLNRTNGHITFSHPLRGTSLPSGHLGDQVLQLVRSQLLVGQANGLHKVVELGRTCQSDEGNVVDLRPVGAIVERMWKQLLDGYVLVGRRAIRHFTILMVLTVGIRASVPFTQPDSSNLQIVSRRLGHTMGSS